jgi:hypothetical protein
VTVLGVLHDVLPLPAYPELHQRVLRSTAYDADIPEPLPHFVERLAHRVLFSSLPIVLLYVDWDAAPGREPTEAGLRRALHRSRAVVRIRNDADWRAASLTWLVARRLEFVLCHD